MQATSSQPLLLGDTLLALSSLYSLPSSSSHQNVPSQHEAHQFLMLLQTRNIRRKLVSWQQRQRDQPQQNDARPESGRMGSSWLTCITILCQVHATNFQYASTERLFASQTLLQRIRRVKTMEAIDWEMELADISMVDRALQSLGTSYAHFVRNILPVIQLEVPVGQTEDVVKAKMSMITLAVTAYFEVSLGESPVLTNIVHTLVTLAFRIFQVDAPANSSLIMYLQDILEVASSMVPSELAEKRLLVTVMVVSSVPDVILGSSGGARGRLSIDRLCIHRAASELRTIDTPILEALLPQIVSLNCDDLALRLTARWVTFLPLTTTWLQTVVPILKRHLQSPQPNQALIVLLAIYEAASWNIDRVQSSRLGMIDQRSEPPNKKRQSSKSKRRQKDALKTNSTSNSWDEARHEQFARGVIACQVTVHCWGELEQLFQRAVQSVSVDSQIEGEGPIGVVAACAHSCLPHVLRHPSPEGTELLQHVSGAVRALCSSPNRSIRMLTLEPLYGLHEVLLEVLRTVPQNVSGTMEQGLFEHFIQCSLGLASACFYPDGYFQNLVNESDHDLEVERNDIRDFLRVIGGSGEGGSVMNPGSHEQQLPFASKVLFRLLQSLDETISSARSHSRGIPEVVVHAFSSLAKPINRLAKQWYRDQQQPADTVAILKLSLKMLRDCNESTVLLFQLPAQASDILQLSRITNIATASFAPFLSAMASSQDRSLSQEVSALLDAIVLGSILSLERLPELAGVSILPHSMYDIRGTMRGPGGEDHVACLTLMRIAMDSDGLGYCHAQSTAPYAERLKGLYEYLKTVEIERGRNVSHGKGVAPQTRRIMVGTFCRLEQLSKGQWGASSMLSAMFDAAVGSIASCDGGSMDEFRMFQLTESVLDVASFAPSIVASIFEDGADERKTRLRETLVAVCSHGYQKFVDGAHQDQEGIVLEWNRLRAAIFVMVRKASYCDPSVAMCSFLKALSDAECLAIQAHFTKVSSSSSIFCDAVISVDAVPSGLCLRNLFESLDRSSSGISERALSLVASLNTSIASASFNSEYPEPDGSFEDPRAPVWEVWIQCLTQLAIKSVDPVAEAILVNNFSSFVMRLLWPSMGKTKAKRASDAGMSLDGPHSLVLLTFFCAFLNRGPTSLKSAGRRLLDHVPIDRASIQIDDPTIQGVAIFAAAVFRACQGALPPWSVEYVPDIFKALYDCIQKDPSTFGKILQASLLVRVGSTNQGIGSVRPGMRLAGCDGLTDIAIEKFVSESHGLCTEDSAVSWKKLKGSVKQLCGGKKKDTDFRQKPALTQWEFERV